jgi:hypothetical protein
MKKLLLLFLIYNCIFLSNVFSQHVGFNTDGSSPHSLLHIHDQSYTANTPLFQITNNTTGAASNALGFTYDFDANFNIAIKNRFENSSAGLSFFTHTNGGSLTEKLTILNDGKVGVGITTPLTLFHIQNSSALHSTLDVANATNNDYAFPLQVLHSVQGAGVGANNIASGIYFSIETTTDTDFEPAGAIGAVAIDATDGSVDGALEFWIAKNSVLTKVISLQNNGTNDILNFGETTIITNVATPVNNLDLVNKYYVDSVLGCKEMYSEEFTANGTFSVPDDVDFVWVSMVGGGGGGGTSALIDDSYHPGAQVASGGGGGGAGQSYIWHRVSVTPGEDIDIAIGAGGAGGVSPGVVNYGQNGSSGGNTTFGDYLTAFGGRGGTLGRWNSTTSVCDGGAGGLGGSGGGLGGDGGSGSTALGDAAEGGKPSKYSSKTIYPGAGGGGGAVGTNTGTANNIGGMGGGVTFAGGSAGTPTTPINYGGAGGGGGSTLFGSGGAGGDPGAWNAATGGVGGSAAANTGAGGGGGGGGHTIEDLTGAGSGAGGAGGSGYVIVYYLR